MKSDQYLETEIKLYVPDLKSVAAQLDSIGAQLTKPRLFERNVRYENKSKTLTSQGIVVRLREDDRIRLTYKEPSTQIDNEISTRFEAEVEVDDFDTMELILGRLGYYPHLVYEKHRATYTFENTEIVLDELPYGNFVEIEGDVNSIQQVIEKLDLQATRHHKDTYVALFNHVCRNLKLEFTDLTFEKFQGIDVPASAFDPA